MSRDEPPTPQAGLLDLFTPETSCEEHRRILTSLLMAFSTHPWGHWMERRGHLRDRLSAQRAEFICAHVRHLDFPWPRSAADALWVRRVDLQRYITGFELLEAFMTHGWGCIAYRQIEVPRHVLRHYAELESFALRSSADHAVRLAARTVQGRDRWVDTSDLRPRMEYSVDGVH